MPPIRCSLRPDLCSATPTSMTPPPIRSCARCCAATCDEALPTLGPVPGVDLSAYCDTLLERFANPQIGDTLARVRSHSSDRMNGFLLPVVRDCLAAGRPFPAAALAIAAWARCTEGTDEQGRAIPSTDLRAPLPRGRALLENAALLGDLVHDPRFSTWSADARCGVALRRHLARRLPGRTARAWSRSRISHDLHCRLRRQQGTCQQLPPVVVLSGLRLLRVLRCDPACAELTHRCRAKALARVGRTGTCRRTTCGRPSRSLRMDCGDFGGVLRGQGHHILSRAA